MSEVVIVEVEATTAVIVEATTAEIITVPEGSPGAPGSPGVGVPTGGSTGQILAKNSPTNYDTEWVDPAAGTGSNVFIQDSDPAIAGPYLWIDTTGGNLQFLVEDGL